MISEISPDLFFLGLLIYKLPQIEKILLFKSENCYDLLRKNSSRPPPLYTPVDVSQLHSVPVIFQFTALRHHVVVDQSEGL